MTSMKRIISQVNARRPGRNWSATFWPTIAWAMLAQIGPEAGLDDHARGRAAFDAGAEKADVS